MNRNITLSLPEEDLQRARILAARRGTSVSRLLTTTLREIIEDDTGYTLAKERSLTRLGNPRNLGTDGHIGWSRDDLHER
jgi:hypothetical protein